MNVSPSAARISSTSATIASSADSLSSTAVIGETIRARRCGQRNDGIEVAVQHAAVGPPERRSDPDHVERDPVDLDGITDLGDPRLGDDLGRGPAPRPSAMSIRCIVRFGCESDETNPFAVPCRGDRRLCFGRDDVVELARSRRVGIDRVASSRRRCRRARRVRPRRSVTTRRRSARRAPRWRRRRVRARTRSPGFARVPDGTGGGTPS